MDIIRRPSTFVIRFQNKVIRYDEASQEKNIDWLSVQWQIKSERVKGQISIGCWYRSFKCDSSILKESICRLTLGMDHSSVADQFWKSQETDVDWLWYRLFKCGRSILEESRNKHRLALGIDHSSVANQFWKGQGIDIDWLLVYIIQVWQINSGRVKMLIDSWYRLFKCCRSILKESRNRCRLALGIEHSSVTDQFWKSQETDVDWLKIIQVWRINSGVYAPHQDIFKLTAWKKVRKIVD